MDMEEERLWGYLDGIYGTASTFGGIAAGIGWLSRGDRDHPSLLEGIDQGYIWEESFYLSIGHCRLYPYLHLPHLRPFIHVSTQANKYRSRPPRTTESNSQSGTVVGNTLRVSEPSSQWSRT